MPSHAEIPPQATCSGRQALICVADLQRDDPEGLFGVVASCRGR